MSKKPYPKVRMVCAVCHRPMARAAALMGGYPVGPKCAVSAGLIKPKHRKPDELDRCDKTMELF